MSRKNINKLQTQIKDIGPSAETREPMHKMKCPKLSFLKKTGNLGPSFTICILITNVIKFIHI